MTTYHGTNAVGGCWSKCVVVGVCSINSSVTEKKINLRLMEKNKKKLKPDIISINKTFAMKYSILAKFLTNKLTLQIRKQYPLGNGKVTNDSKCIISFMRLLGISIRLRREAVEQWQARGVRSVLTAHSCSFCTRDTKTLAQLKPQFSGQVPATTKQSQ